MQKIKTTSQLLCFFFRAVCLLLPLVTAYLIFFHLGDVLNAGFFDSIISSSQIQDVGHFSLWHRLIILAIQLLPLSITVLICHQLAGLFHLYGQGYLFEESNIRLIKAISIYMIAGELVHIIYQPLITAALTFNNPVGERFATISLSTTNIATLITAAIILIASWIVKEAQLLKADAQLTI
ncbi:DUF2975 domain-containing protein [Legionella sp. CNM-4043-24]|uniref:DUF2975 domain-containing protein n=1 Tax=Legionella sp. CNM-4043-24 TaxID=3421646 RepID=UPI00403A80D5